MAMHLRIFREQLLLGLKLHARKPPAVFWLVCFPVVMLLVLGAVFGRGAEPSQRLVWARDTAPSSLDNLFQRLLEERGLIVEVLVPADAESRWQSGKLAALLRGGSGHYTFRINKYLRGQGGQLEARVQEVFLATEARMSGVGELARIPVADASPGGRGGGSYVEYLLPGLLGLNLLMVGVFSCGMLDVTMRAKGGYKRLATTPLRRPVYLAAQIGVQLVLALISATLLGLAGKVIFGISNQGSYVSLFALLVLGATCFISLGYLLASFASSVEAYDGMANAVFLSLMLISGVYYTLDTAPLWLQRLADWLPLAPMLGALRAVFNDGAELGKQGPATAVLAAWTAVLFILAVRRFKWI